MKVLLLLLCILLACSCGNPAHDDPKIGPFLFYSDSFTTSIGYNANPYSAFSLYSSEANITVGGTSGIKCSFTKNDTGINFFQVTINNDIYKGHNPKVLYFKAFVPMASAEDIKIDSVYMIGVAPIYISSATTTVYRSLDYQQFEFDLSSINSELTSGKIVFGLKFAVPSIATVSSPAFIYIDDIVFEY